MAAEQEVCGAAHRRRWAAGLTTVVVGCCLLITAGAPAQTASPQTGQAASPPPVEILRGSAAPPPARVEPAAGPDQRRAVGGERVWFVDEGSGTLTGCRLINTIYVGRQAIRCTERRLPKGRPVRD